MNTPAHVLYGLVAFARPNTRRMALAAGAGALLPDLSLYVMVGWAVYVMGIPRHVVFGQFYYSDAWQRVFSIDNSFIFWGIGLALAMWWGSRTWTAFAASGLLHLAMDFTMHHDDARPQFWPLTDWVFRSPFSYWDRAHHAALIGPLELAAAAICTAILLARFRGGAARIVIALIFVLEALAMRNWVFFF